MKQQKSQLGKGLGALLGGGASLNQEAPKVTETKPKLENNGPLLVDISLLKANKDQPRKIFKDQEILELSNSIKENGIIQPIVVSQDEAGKFTIIAGERRFRASKLAGLEKVPVVIKRVTKKETLVMAIIENVQRADLNCIEEGLAYYQLMTEFGLTQEEVAKKIGKERSTIANFLRILKLPREVISYIQKDELSFGHAKVLASVKDDEKVKRMALEAIQSNYSVRELESALKKVKKPKNAKTNPFFDEKIDNLRQNLEKKTGFHFDLKSKTSGSGTITIKYNNEAEFNDVYEYLMRS